MIQRVQSIWLVLAVITLVCTFFLPLLTKNADGIEYSIYTSGVRQQIETEIAEQYIAEIAILPITLNVAAVLLCLIAIFFFRNRSLQKGIITTGILVIIALLSFWIFTHARAIPGGIENARYGIGTFLPVLAVAFCLLAIRGIRKDEQLLRSADRLR